LYFIILFLPFKGIDCQQSWIQPPSSSVSPAGTIRLSYTTQVDNTISWYQQKAGKGPRFVHCDGCGSKIPNRFTATRSGTTGTLTITNVEAEDEADYYCGTWNSAGNVLHGCYILMGKGQKPPSSSSVEMVFNCFVLSRRKDKGDCRRTQVTGAGVCGMRRCDKNPHSSSLSLNKEARYLDVTGDS
uniref:Ig-like domain-containing protein n=1 Tax=Naja naja TaxID=35670 RepID=A0A8C6X3Z1_NAJNA